MDIEIRHHKPSFMNGLPDEDEGSDDIIHDNGPESPHVEAWRPRRVTIEPVLFLYLLAGGLMTPTFSALLYRKVCIAKFSRDVCDNLHNSSHHAEEDIVQGQASHWMLWMNYALSIPAIILALAYGMLSDHISRRLTIAMPVFGQVLSGVTYMIAAIYMESHVGFTLLGNLLNGILGAWVTLFMACFSYLSEATSQKDRTRRVLIAEGIAGLSVGISLLASGILLDHTSFTFVFSLCIGISLLCIIYIIVYIKEPPKKDIWQQKKRLPCSVILHHVKDAFATVFKRRGNNGRTRVLVSIMIMFTAMISNGAMYTLGYLFLKRRPLSWTQTMFGIYSAVSEFIPSVSLMVLVPWLQSHFKLRDTTLMIIGLVSNCLSEFWFSFCTQSWMAFIRPIIGILGRTLGSVLRSILSKLVLSHELGQLFAVVGATQSLSDMVGSTLYNTVYPHTLTFWPGFCFTLGTIIAIFPASMIWWLHRDLGRSPLTVLTRHLSEVDLTHHMEDAAETSNRANVV